jgi:hypothetical protein
MLSGNMDQKTGGDRIMRNFYRSGTCCAILLAALLLSACSRSPTNETVGGTQSGTQASQSGFRASLDILSQVPSGENVQLQFTLVNESEARLYLLRWYTPLEGIAGEILIVKRDGKLLPYRGILASRVPPTPDDYVALDAGASVSVVAEGYDLSEPGEYTVKFLSPRISHVARSEAEMATTMEELGPVQIPAHEITFNISGGQAAAPKGTELVGYLLVAK